MLSTVLLNVILIVLVKLKLVPIYLWLIKKKIFKFFKSIDFIIIVIVRISNRNYIKIRR